MQTVCPPPPVVESPAGLFAPYSCTGGPEGVPGDPEPPDSQLPSPQGGHHEQYVLIADADRLLASRMRSLVEELGYRATIARTGHEALEVAGRQQPVAAILDLGLPGLYGGTVAETLRMQNSSLPIILLS